MLPMDKDRGGGRTGAFPQNWSRGDALRWMLVAAVFGVGSVQADPKDGSSIRDFLARYHCPVLDRLDRIAAHEPSTTRNRFLTLWPKGRDAHYVQCIFAAGNVEVECEAASGAYEGSDALLMQPRVVAALGEIGFRNSGSAKNYVMTIPLSGARALDSVADRMLLVMYVFGARPGSTIVIKAPFGGKGAGCVPIS